MYDDLNARFQNPGTESSRSQSSSVIPNNSIRTLQDERRSTSTSRERSKGYDEEAAREALMGTREVPSALRKSKTVRFTDSLVETDDLDNGQVLQLHQRIMEDQDESLDRLSQSISRQRELSLQIGDELDSHAELLDDVDGLVDRTQHRLTGARKRMDTITRKAKDNGKIPHPSDLFILLCVIDN